LFACQEPVPRELAGFRHGNPLTRFHLGNALSNDVAVLLTTQRIHCLSMNVGIDDEAHPLGVRVNDFEFAFPRRVQCSGQFFSQFRGHAQIIPQFAAPGDERSFEMTDPARDNLLP
jgi:hypothetical protein